MGFDDGESAMLKEGSQIQDTKSAMVLEDLIGQFLYGDKNLMVTVKRLSLQYNNN